MSLFDFNSVRASRGELIHFLHDARSFPELAENAQAFLERVNATETVGDTVTIPSSEKALLALLLEGMGYRHPTPYGHWGVHYTYATSIGAIGFSAPVSNRPYRIPNFYHNPHWSLRFDESTRPFFVKLVADHVELAGLWNNLNNLMWGTVNKYKYKKLSSAREILDQMTRSLEIQYVTPDVASAEKIIPLQKEAGKLLKECVAGNPPPSFSTSVYAKGVDFAAKRYSDLARKLYGKVDGKKEAQLFITSLQTAALTLYKRKEDAPARLVAFVETLVSLALANLVTTEFLLRVMDDVVQAEIIEDKYGDEKLLAIRGLAFQIAEFTGNHKSECLKQEQDFRSQYKLIMKPPKQRDPVDLEWYESFKNREPSATNPLKKWMVKNGIEAWEKNLNPLRLDKLTLSREGEPVVHGEQSRTIHTRKSELPDSLLAPEIDKPQASLGFMVHYQTDGNTALSPLEESLTHFIEPVSANDNLYPPDPTELFLDESPTDKNPSEDIDHNVLPKRTIHNVWKNASPSMAPLQFRTTSLVLIR